jgi:hypothetical protein
LAVKLREKEGGKQRKENFALREGFHAETRGTQRTCPWRELSEKEWDKGKDVLFPILTSAGFFQSSS